MKQSLKRFSRMIFEPRCEYRGWEPLTGKFAGLFARSGEPSSSTGEIRIKREPGGRFGGYSQDEGTVSNEESLETKAQPPWKVGYGIKEEL